MNWTSDIHPDDFKNTALSRLMYEAAASRTVFADMFPVVPLTRWQRLKWWLESYIPHLHFGSCATDDE